MLEKVKLALRIVTTAYDSQLTQLIAAAKLDLGIAGVVLPTELDELCEIAITTYVQLHFGEPDNYDRLQVSYDLQKAQLSMATGYTIWTDQT